MHKPNMFISTKSLHFKHFTICKHINSLWKDYCILIPIQLVNISHIVNNLHRSFLPCFGKIFTLEWEEKILFINENGNLCQHNLNIEWKTRVPTLYGCIIQCILDSLAEVIKNCAVILSDFCRTFVCPVMQILNCKFLYCI